MKNFNDFLNQIGFELYAFFGGLAGAFVSQKGKKKTFYERFTAVLSGGLIANYLTPLFLDFINLGERGAYGMAFILGFMGMAAVENFISYLQNRFEK